MAVFDLFSKRQKRLRGEVVDVYQYDDFPGNLRVQIVHIMKNALVNERYYDNTSSNNAFKMMVDILCKEYGVFTLPPAKSRYRDEYQEELFNFLLNTSSTEEALDVVELGFRVIDRMTRTYEYAHREHAEEFADDAIDELNQRFQEAGVGFQFINRELIRIDSQVIHSEVVKPALKLLNAPGYSGAQEEFLNAHEHYRRGNNKEALNDCLKSFESTMKSICDKRGWVYSPNDTAQKLLKVCFDNNLVPPFWQGQLTSLRALLESSVPTGRNKLSGHGQGSVATNVPDYLVAYMIHMTAASIVFLTSANDSLV